jgi:hypothetical protein
MAIQLTDAQRQKLERGFQNWKPGPVRPASPELAIDDFCRHWPGAKNVLLTLASLPGVPDSVQKNVNDVVSAGDFAASTLCG